MNALGTARARTDENSTALGRSRRFCRSGKPPTDDNGTNKTDRCHKYARPLSLVRRAGVVPMIPVRSRCHEPMTKVLILSELPKKPLGRQDGKN